MFGTRSLGSIIGLLQGGSVAAGVVGPLFMAAIFVVNGNYSVSIWVMVAVCALMAPLSFSMSSPRALRARLSALSP